MATKRARYAASTLADGDVPTHKANAVPAAFADDGAVVVVERVSGAVMNKSQAKRRRVAGGDRAAGGYTIHALEGAYLHERGNIAIAGGAIGAGREGDQAGGNDKAGPHSTCNTVTTGDVAVHVKSIGDGMLSASSGGGGDDGACLDAAAAGPPSRPRAPPRVLTNADVEAHLERTLPGAALVLPVYAMLRNRGDTVSVRAPSAYAVAYPRLDPEVLAELRAACPAILSTAAADFYVVSGAAPVPMRVVLCPGLAPSRDVEVEAGDDEGRKAYVRHVGRGRAGVLAVVSPEGEVSCVELHKAVVPGGEEM